MLRVEQLEQSLAEINSRYGTKISLGPDLTCAFRDSSGLCCHLQVDSLQEELCLCAEICRVEPEGAGEDSLRRLLQTAFLGRETAGGGIGLDEEGRRVVLWWRLPLDELSSSALEKALRKMIAAGRGLKSRLASLGHEAGSGGLPPDLSWPGALRI